MLHGLAVQIKMKELIEKSGKESFTKTEIDILFFKAIEAISSEIEKVQTEREELVAKVAITPEEGTDEMAAGDIVS